MKHWNKDRPHTEFVIYFMYLYIYCWTVNAGESQARLPAVTINGQRRTSPNVNVCRWRCCHLYLSVWQRLSKLSDFLRLQIVDSRATTAVVP